LGGREGESEDFGDIVMREIDFGYETGYQKFWFKTLRPAEWKA
jgi:hypothetical protein